MFRVTENDLNDLNILFSKSGHEFVDLLADQSQESLPHLSLSVRGRRLLTVLRRDAARLVERKIRFLFERIDERLKLEIPDLELDLDDPTRETFVYSAVRSFEQYASKIYNSLERDLTKTLSGRFENTRSNPSVTVIGRSGRAFKYPLAYYATLVVYNTLAKGEREYYLTRLAKHGKDLVQASLEKSSSEVCEKFKGKVFSISGRTVGVPKLSDTPNGGPPWHPWCQHIVTVV